MDLLLLEELFFLLAHLLIEWVNIWHIIDEIAYNQGKNEYARIENLGPMSYMIKQQRLVDEYRYPGFRPLATIRNHPVDSDARIITMRRRQKKRFADAVERFIIHSMTERNGLSVTCHAQMHGYILKLRYVG
jgi:hypothetical protein